MSQLPDNPNGPDTSSLAVIIDTVGAFFGQVPAGLKRNVGKALGHLFKVPNAYLDGWAEEIKATSEARVKITKAAGTKLAQAIHVDPALAQIAMQTHASKILRQQTNATKVLKFAADEIGCLPYDETTVENAEISDDWLNAFESEAVNMSSEQMQKLFGKMLAGEICKPSSFSIRTVKLMGQMDNDVAAIFRKFCSMSFTHKVGPNVKVMNGGPITLGLQRSTALHDFDLGYFSIAHLEEYGLISNSVPAEEPLFFSIYDEKNNSTQIPLSYNNVEYVLKPKDSGKLADFAKYGTYTLTLSRVGRELFNVVELEENLEYTKALTAFFEKEGLLFCKSPLNLKQGMLPNEA